MILRSSVAPMTSTDVITSLASVTSTASFASKNQKLLALESLDDFPVIRNLSSLNDLNSLNGLSGLDSLISSKHLLSMMLPITWQQNDLSWSLNVKWILKNPLFYGFLAVFLLEAVEAFGCYFQQNPRVISQNSTSHECTDTVFIT